MFIIKKKYLEVLHILLVAVALQIFGEELLSKCFAPVVHKLLKCVFSHSLLRHLYVCFELDAGALVDDVIGPGGNKTAANKSSFIM